MEVYHGSPNLFEVFDYSRIGQNGTSEGYGFYFTDNLEVAKSYATNGYLYTVELKGQKPLSFHKLTITKKKLRRLLIVLNDQNEYLSNFGDVNFEGLESVLDKAVEIMYDTVDNDVDLVGGIINSYGDVGEVLKNLHATLGYDYIKTTAEWGSQTLYIALIPDIIKIQDVKSIRRCH